MSYTAVRTGIFSSSTSSAHPTLVPVNKQSATASRCSTAFTRKRFLLRSTQTKGRWIADWDRILVNDQTPLFTPDKNLALQFVTAEAAATRCCLIMQNMHDSELADMCIEEVEL